MKAAGPGSGLIFRVVVSGFTSFLLVSVMSMALGFIASAAAAGGGISGGITGNVIQAHPVAAYLYLTAQIIVGILAFFGSFYVVSKKQ
jgi:hypothetical protein